MSKPKNAIQQKTCARCETVKPKSEFYGSGDGYCKTCRCEYNKQKRKNAPLSFSAFYRVTHLAYLDKETGERVKRCSSCEKLKNIKDFHKRKTTTSDGYRGCCKSCHNKKCEDWRKENPDKVFLSYIKSKTLCPERFKKYTKTHYYKHRHQRIKESAKYKEDTKNQTAADSFFQLQAAAQEISTALQTKTNQ